MYNISINCHGDVTSNSLVFNVHIFCKYIYAYCCTRSFWYISFEIHSNINNGKSEYLLFCKFFFLCIENKNDQILHDLKVNLYSILYLLHLSDEIDLNVGKSRTIILVAFSRIIEKVVFNKSFRLIQLFRIQRMQLQWKI